MTSATGTASDTYTYLAFGELDTQSGTTANNYLYTGEQYDPNVGFYYLRARYYNPSIGRFQTMDTYAGRMHEPATLHKYLYVHANPINMVDPSGLVGLLSVTSSNFISSSISVARTRAGVSFVARTALKIAFETVTGIPVIGSPRDLARAVRKFPAVGANLRKGGLKKLLAGNDFEKKVIDLWPNLKKNTQCLFTSGLSGRKGCRIPDVWSRGKHLIEIKTSLAAFRKGQFQDFLKLSANTGTPMTVLVRNKPTGDDLARLQRWAQEVLPSNDDILFKIVHLAD